MRILNAVEMDHVAGGFSISASNVNNGSAAGSLALVTSASTNGVGVATNGTAAGGAESAGLNVNSSGGNSTLFITF